MMAAQELFHVFAVLLVLLALVSSTSGRDTQLGDSDAVSRAELTLQGLFNYYWKNDPSHKQIKFLFACGQLGQMGTAKPSQCSCYSPSSCVNCYRWWTAIMMESVATYGIYMNTSNHSSLPDTIYSHSPYNAKWDAVATCTFVDDFLWYGIAYLRVYDWLAVSIISTPVFRLVVTKKRRESAHARDSPFKIPIKMCACADSRCRFFCDNQVYQWNNLSFSPGSNCPFSDAYEKTLHMCGVDVGQRAKTETL